MTDSDLLILTLVGLYLLECLSWFRGDGHVFFRFFSFTFKLKASFVDKPWGIPVLSNPFPPLDSSITSENLSVDISPEGIVDREGSTHFAFDDLTTAECEGHWLVLNGTKAVRSASVKNARSLADFITLLAGTTPEARATAIRERYSSFVDLRSLRSRFELLRSKSEGLWIVSNVAFLALFVLVPVALLGDELVRSWPWLVAELAGLMVLAALFFADAHKTLFPGEGEDRLRSTLLILLWPLSSVRANDHLRGMLYQWYHPVVVGYFLSKNVQLFREELYDLRYGQFDPKSPEAARIRTWSRQELSKALFEMLEAEGIEADEVFGPPVGLGGSAFYCPRCSNEYTHGRAECSDCGVPLSPAV